MTMVVLLVLHQQMVDGTNDVDNNYVRQFKGHHLLQVVKYFDFETNSSYNVYRNTNDGTDNYAKAFTLSVNHVNEAPDDIKFGKNIFKDGLLLHLDSEVLISSSGSIWNDLSGNSYNGTFAKSPSFSNDNGGMINLNGSTQWMTVNSFSQGCYLIPRPIP